MYNNPNKRQAISEALSDNQKAKLDEIAFKAFHEQEKRRITINQHNDQSEESYTFRQFKRHLRTRKIPYSLYKETLTLGQVGTFEFAGLHLRFSKEGYVRIHRLDNLEITFNLFAETSVELITKMLKHGIIKEHNPTAINTK